MTGTVGIRFPSSGKIYSFSSAGMELRPGDRVVVESDLGISIGTVARQCSAARQQSEGPKPEPQSEFRTEPGPENPSEPQTEIQPELQPEPKPDIRPVLRKVTAADLKQEEENEEVKREALIFCNERIATRGLDMKLITAEVTLDRKRFIFYFVSETRIDFRELVKDLASKLRARIELRQIGVRDAAKMVGGFGICGLEVCCKTWLRGFAPISIKMAKQQDLVLNTCKLSGLCGRLMCCLNYEYDEDAVRKRKKRGTEQRETEAEAMTGAKTEAVLEAGVEPEPEPKPEPESEPESEKAPETGAVTGVETKPAAIARAAHEIIAAETSRPRREHEARRPERSGKSGRPPVRPERPDRTIQQPQATQPAPSADTSQAGGPSHAVPADAPGSPFKKRRKRRRGKHQLGAQQQASAQAVAPSGEHQPEHGAGQDAGPDGLSRSKRRRMRRNRHKKPHDGQPHGGQPHGGQPHGGEQHGGPDSGSASSGQ